MNYALAALGVWVFLLLFLFIRNEAVSHSRKKAIEKTSEIVRGKIGTPGLDVYEEWDVLYLSYPSYERMLFDPRGWHKWTTKQLFPDLFRGELNV